MSTINSQVSAEDIKELCDQILKYNYINPDDFNRFNVKRGLRNSDGTGVMAGISRVCSVEGYYISDGERIPKDGRLTFRGISMEDIAKYVERIIVMNHGHVAFDDTPKKVFAHYKELEKIGLAAPQMTYIMHALKEHGMDVDVTATTVEEARDTILAALGSQKKNGKKGAEVC